jgi:hypothetical protein
LAARLVHDDVEQATGRWRRASDLGHQLPHLLVGLYLVARSGASWPRDPGDRSALQDVVEPEPEHPAPDVVLGQIHQLAAGVDPGQQEVTVGGPLLRTEVALRVLEVELDLEPRGLGEGQRQRAAREREAEQQPAAVAAGARGLAGRAGESVNLGWASRVVRICGSTDQRPRIGRFESSDGTYEVNGGKRSEGFPVQHQLSRRLLHRSRIAQRSSSLHA